jgi:hypothetical protein
MSAAQKCNRVWNGVIGRPPGSYRERLFKTGSAGDWDRSFTRRGVKILEQAGVNVETI